MDGTKLDWLFYTRMAKINNNHCVCNKSTTGLIRFTLRTLHRTRSSKRNLANFNTVALYRYARSALANRTKRKQFCFRLYFGPSCTSRLKSPAIVLCVLVMTGHFNFVISRTWTLPHIDQVVVSVLFSCETDYQSKTECIENEFVIATHPFCTSAMLIKYMAQEPMYHENCPSHNRDLTDHFHIHCLPNFSETEFKH